MSMWAICMNMGRARQLLVHRPPFSTLRQHTWLRLCNTPNEARTVYIQCPQMHTQSTHTRFMYITQYTCMCIYRCQCTLCNMHRHEQTHMYTMYAHVHVDTHNTYTHEQTHSPVCISWTDIQTSTHIHTQIDTYTCLQNTYMQHTYTHKHTCTYGPAIFMALTPTIILGVVQALFLNK